jgi:[ribosomal protein S18]-alanine N-acetyltransferase
MRLFRKSIDISRATTRLSIAEDLTAVSRLLRNGGRRYYGFSGAELPQVLANQYGSVLLMGSELWGTVIVSQPAEATAWLRGFAVAEGVEVRAALAALLPPLLNHLAEREFRYVFYAGDESAETWLDAALRDYGFSENTTVVVYEKRDLLIPERGNRAAFVRTAIASDLPAVLQVDQRCFEAQWTKDDTILGPAIEQGPLFVVAELAGQVVGYAYATTHFSGHLVHLVRIAVDPALQGSRLGIRLMAEVVEFARAVGADLLTLNTQLYNTHAQRLYRWFGFTPSGERQIVLRYDIEIRD